MLDVVAPHRNPFPRRTRPRRIPPAAAWVFLVWTIFSGQSVAAQESEEGTTDSEESTDLERPELEQFVEADYPESARSAGVEGTVVLILTIDASGEVTRVEVERGPGHGLNRAARAAAREFAFEPARRGGEAVASRIRYRYDFELPAGAGRRSASPDEQTPDRAPAKSDDAPRDEEDVPRRGRLQGTVLLPGGDSAAAGTRVALVGPEGRERVVRTDADGAFHTDSLAPGRYLLTATATEGVSGELRTEVLPGETTEVTVRLRESGEDRTIEVTVRGESKGEQLEQSARAVDVIETERAAEKADDLGEVVANEKGVNVRRTGGLGSGTRFSLNGLSDNQVRFFLDGIPLEYAGFPFGLANVPVNLVERIDIYKGVVPIRYGADALGGAVDLIPKATPAEPAFGGSYQIGSYDTHRLTLHGESAGPDSEWYARGNAFVDSTNNDYPVDVEVADRSGEIYDVTARRFHDDYRALGTGIEVGTLDRPWADELSARLFFSDFARDLQHNLIMTVPYGEARYGETVAGGLLRYEETVSRPFRVELAAGYNFTRTWFEDRSDCHYDWFGRCTSERNRPGEIGKFASDQRIWEHAGFGRFNGIWELSDDRELRFAIAPTYVTRTGDERADTPRADRDPLEAERDLVDLVTGLEYESNLADDRLQNIGFFKDYVQIAKSDERLPSSKDVSHDRTTHQLGAGDSLRYGFTEWLHGKLSYEWATRLPSAEELFGNGARIQPNPELEPERSHNANLEFAADGLESPAGSWRANATGFLRSTNHLIVLIGGARSFSYQNVLRARAAGVEGAVGWRSPGEHFAVDLNATYVDLRNVARRGTFGEFHGDRVPNRPHLYGNGTARVRETGFFVDGDSVTATWESRYVHEYFRSWASIGRPEFKQVIPSQWRQSVALTYGVDGPARSTSFTVEVQNLTDAEIYDFYGVQQPGRAFYFKSTVEL